MKRRNYRNDGPSQFHPLDSSKTKAAPAPKDAAILQLNNDSLRYIFSYLNMNDLWSIANVSSHFAVIARTQFAIRNTSINLKAMRFENMANLRFFLAIFGTHIVSLQVPLPNLLQSADEFELQHDIQESIVHYCSGTLTELTLAHFTIKRAKMWQPLFAGLRKLRLHRCRFTDQFIQMLACCVELEQMDWNTSTIDINWSLRFPLPKLKIFRVNEVVGITTHTMTTFLQLNPQLKEIGVTKCIGIDHQIFAEISRNVQLIEHISYMGSLCSKFHDGMLVLRQLKTLKIDCKNNEKIPRVFSKFTAAGIWLEHLDLASCVSSERLLENISRMKTMKSLGLFSISGMKIRHLLNVIGKLENLTHLRIVECIGLNTEGLLQIVRVAKKLQQLQFHSHVHKLVIEDDVRDQLLATVQQRPDRVPLHILTVGFDKNVRETWASCEDHLTITCDPYIALCNRYLADDFFLFNFFYDLNLEFNANHKSSTM